MYFGVTSVNTKDSVPTSVEELSSLRDVMNRNINVFEKATITSEIVKTCISKLNSGKDDGDIGLNLNIL